MPAASQRRDGCGSGRLKIGHAGVSRSAVEAVPPAVAIVKRCPRRSRRFRARASLVQLDARALRRKRLGMGFASAKARLSSGLVNVRTSFKGWQASSLSSLWEWRVQVLADASTIRRRRWKRMAITWQRVGRCRVVGYPLPIRPPVVAGSGEQTLSPME